MEHPEYEEVVKALGKAKRDVGNMRVQIADYRQIVKELSDKLKSQHKALNGLGRAPTGEHE